MRLFSVLMILGIHLFGQDPELLEYVNDYRKVHGLKKLKWNNELALVSIDQNTKVVQADSLFHTEEDVFENVAYGEGLPYSGSEYLKFQRFCKYYFRFDYNVDLLEDSLVSQRAIYKMYMVYLWHYSPPHRENMQNRSVKIGAAESYYAIPEESEYGTGWMYATLNFDY